MHTHLNMHTHTQCTPKENTWRIFLLLDTFFTFQMLFPFLICPPKTPLSHPSSPFSPTHPLPLPCPGIPLHWGIEPSQSQGRLLSLMSHKAILCYICSWSHGSFHVYSLVGGLVPRNSEGYWLVHIVVLPMGLQTLQLLGSFIWLLHGGPCAQSNGWL